MEVKIDKRTKEYKESQNDTLEQPSPLEAVESAASDGVVEPIQPAAESPPTPDSVVAAIKLLESVGATVTPPPQDTEPQPVVSLSAILTEAEWEDLKKRRAIKGTPPGEQPVVLEQSKAAKADLLHCPGCQVELLEDERNTKGPAYCRKCIWKEA